MKLIITLAIAALPAILMGCHRRVAGNKPERLVRVDGCDWCGHGISGPSPAKKLDLSGKKPTIRLAAKGNK